MTCPKCGQDHCRQCASCGDYECGHHKFVPVVRMTGKCCCESSEWIDPANIPAACGKFAGDVGSYCETCEHDYECHVEGGQP